MKFVLLTQSPGACTETVSSCCFHPLNIYVTAINYIYLQHMHMYILGLSTISAICNVNSHLIMVSKEKKKGKQRENIFPTNLNIDYALSRAYSSSITLCSLPSSSPWPPSVAGNEASNPRTTPSITLRYLCIGFIQTGYSSEVFSQVFSCQQQRHPL